MMFFVFATANAQPRDNATHSHYDEPEVIDGRMEPERLSPGVKLRYVLTARLTDLKDQLSDEDFAVVSAGVEEIKAEEERRIARELEDFDHICRNLAHLDVETILQVIERPHADMMSLRESAVRRHISGLSGLGQKVLRDMVATTDYHILIVHPDNSEYARAHPDFFRASVSDKCQLYLSQVDETDE
jgi:hypothetical protein